MEYSKKTSNCKLLLLDGYYTRQGPPNDIYCIIEEPYKHYFTEKVSYSQNIRKMAASPTDMLSHIFTGLAAVLLPLQQISPKKRSKFIYRFSNIIIAIFA